MSPFSDATERCNEHANDGSESHDCDAQRKVDVNFAGFLGFVTDNLVALIDAVH